jgi:hypothetical protein
VKNKTLGEFWERFDQLPAVARAQARKAFRRFENNPQHPSLRFKPLQGYPHVYSVRIGLHHRAVAKRVGDVLHWFWIGSHSDFDKEFS